MTRPPVISLIFFIAPAAIILFAFFEQNPPTPPGAPLYSSQAKPGVMAPTAQAVSEMHMLTGGNINYADPFDPRFPFRAKSDRAGAPSTTAAAIFNPQDDYWGLARTPGFEYVATQCSGCHSLEIVMQQRMTPDRWDYTLNWMVEKQGMAQLASDEREVIFDYLVTHFAAK